MPPRGSDHSLAKSHALWGDICDGLTHWRPRSLRSQFAFLTAKQGVAVSPLDKREVGLRVNWKF